MPEKVEILINSASNEIMLIIYSADPENLIDNPDAAENLEARYQLKEGCFYEYKITDNFSLETDERDIISPSKINTSTGRIAPNIYVGTLKLGIRNFNKEKCGEIQLEVQSVKTSYREDYRFMLEEITDKCHDLLLQHSSPISQNLEPDYFKDPQTAYQRFAFIKSILESQEFDDAIHKIIISPVTRWEENEVVRDVRGVKRFSNNIIRQFASSSNRFELPEGNSLRKTIYSLPIKVTLSNKTETVDSVENRFIKYALLSFQSLCSDFAIKVNNNTRLKNEANKLVDKIEELLNYSVFKEISTLKVLPFNSPILQRKEGYREIFRAWLMFNLAAKLIWTGGEDIYSANKKDVAVLYEYWLFFKLLEVIQEIFGIQPKNLNELIKETSDGLGLQLKQGKCLAIKGVFESEIRRLNIEFSYNKTFAGESIYPEKGSWTKNMRPDYTLSIWPLGISADQAEEQELIAHIHFDSKYKVERLVEILGDDNDFENEKEEQKKGTYKRADLLKMHAYKDAIRRTAGCYILYPGEDSTYRPKGFHEVIPGLGAFAIRPSRTNNGTAELKNFLNEVVHHFQNRISQREKILLKTYEIYKDKKPNELNEKLPETYGVNRDLIPDETFVLVAFYKNEEQLNWVKKNKLYNARTGSKRGSLHLSLKEATAKYLLLHGPAETTTSKLYKLSTKGPAIYSKTDLINKLYPSPSQDFYLVYSINSMAEKEFENMAWDITKLDEYTSNRESPFPFATSLSDLMKALIKPNRLQ
jgi:predicted component of viral defense system (DUF524 family)